MSTVHHALLTGALVPHTEHRCLGVARQEFMGSALPWKSIASSSNFSETFSRATINFSSAEDKTRSRHPSCNKWGHRKMGSRDCRILNCGFTPSLGRHRLGGCGCVCAVSQVAHGKWWHSESSFKSSSCSTAVAEGGWDRLQGPGWSTGAILGFNSRAFLCQPLILLR